MTGGDRIGVTRADGGGAVATRLDAALAELTVSARRRGWADLLAGFTTLAVEHLPGVDHAGITAVTESRGGVRVVRSYAATDGHPLVLDNIQRRMAEGPGVATAVERRRHVVDDLAAETRWPAFVTRAVVSTPVRALVSVPLSIGEEQRAALTLYADRAHGLDGRVVATAELLAQHLGRAVSGRGPRRGSRSDVINRAKRLLMQRFDIDVAQAFSMLVSMSKQQHESIEAVARALLAEDRPDSGRSPEEQLAR